MGDTHTGNGAHDGNGRPDTSADVTGSARPVSRYQPTRRASDLPPLDIAGIHPSPDRKLNDEKMSEAAAQRVGRLGGGFRTMIFSSMATLLVIIALPLVLGLPSKVDPWSISSIANGNVNVTFLDANGDLLAHRGYRQEETVSLDEMPPYLVQAVLAMEDRRFYRHWGVDILGVLRAAQANFAANRIVEGGSTITQQLARNLYLDGSRNFGRKAQEAALAFWLEQHLTKTEILELYLNRIYLGAGAYGVEAASQVYFSKSVRDLTVSEAALIAGLPKAPAQLSPARDLARAQERAALVLEKLEETGWMSAAEIEAARAEPAMIDLEERSRELLAPYFVDWVYSRLPLWIDGPPRELVVETTIDLEMQRKAEEAVRATFERVRRGVEVDQAALVSINLSGEVKAMVGGQDYLESQFNRATQAIRQPGSAFKPIVYMAALQNGYTPYSGVVDRPVRISGWRPLNANRRYSGWMQMRNAVAYSVNTIAVRVAHKVGLEKVADYARASGISTPMPEHPSLALGAMGTRLFELTGAYAPLANGGFETPAHGIRRITNVDGKVLYERARRVIGALPPPYSENNYGKERVDEDAETVPLFAKVASTSDARTMTNMLRRVISIGTGKKASLGRREAAGKTGTTNDNRDAVFVGYTADLVTGVWMGNDNNAEMGRVYGGTLPATMWANFMKAAHEGMPRRKIYKQHWVMPHPSQYKKKQPEAESAQEEVPVAETQAPPKYSGLRSKLTGLSGALSAATPLQPTVAETVQAPRSRRMDRSVFRNRED